MVEQARAYFTGKKVTVMGLGLLGRGIGDTAFLAECGAEVIVTDLKSKEQLTDALDALSGFSNITYVLGEHRMEDFENRDLILVAAGVPLDSPYLAHARKAGVRLAQSAALFAEISKIPIIGVTGTRGKSTVTHMIHHVLTHATEGGKVLLGGNVRGVSNLQLLNEVEEDLTTEQAGSLAVMELDSWQLQGFGWANISPQIAVFTTFMEDHMNYYQNDMDAYFFDKAQIFLHQEADGVLVTTKEIFERAQQLMQKLGKEFEQEVRLVDSSILPEDCLLKIPGEHNRLNAALATEALRSTGLTDEEIFEGLTTFPGVAGRLELVKNVRGIKIYNDATATSPDAVIAALKTLGKTQNIILILGGVDKNFNLDPLIDSVNMYTREIFLLPGSGTDKLVGRLRNAQRKIYDSFTDAVHDAFSACQPGDILLLSPGFSSKSIFKNEYDRYDQFNTIVNDL